MKFTNILILQLKAILLTILFSSFVFGQQISDMKEEIVLESEQFKLVELAIAEFKKSGLDSVSYKLSIYSHLDNYVAIFEDPKISSSQRGSSPNMPSFEIEFDKNHNVIRSNFAK